MKLDSNGRYRMRRQDRDMPERADQLDVIRGGKYLTLAMSRENEPYGVALNYAFAEDENCFYVHGATSGKKLDFLRSNPQVWGLVVEDRGYLVGQASYAYRAVMFQGLVEFVDEPEAKRRALAALLERYQPDSEPLRAKMLADRMVDKTVVLRVRVLAMTGKQNPAPGA